MSWIVLLAGIALWWGAHLFKRVAPERRAAMGEAGKGPVALALFASVILMVIGYRWTPYVSIWVPALFFTVINNLLVLVAIYLMSPAPKKGALLNGMRHPMLTGFALWAFGHLLVNGDLTAIVTFGALLAWAVAEVRVINAAEPGWSPAPKGSLRFDAIFAAASVVGLLAIGLIHYLLGVWPFSGAPPF
ncbi:MAG: NnrU family protein [Pseudomonadota bacterium]